MERGIFATGGLFWLSTGLLRAALPSINVSEADLSAGTLGVNVHAAITMTTGNMNIL